MARRASEPPLKSLDVALRVLEALDDGAPERGISDLARELGVSPAAIHRILSTLALRGRHPEPRFLAVRHRPPAAAFQPRRHRQARSANHRPAVHDRAARRYARHRPSGGARGQRSGLHRQRGRAASGSGDVAGGRALSRHCVATGKALLAFADATMQEILLSSGLTRYTPLTHAEPDDFDRRWRRSGPRAAPSTWANGGARSRRGRPHLRRRGGRGRDRSSAVRRRACPRSDRGSSAMVTDIAGRLSLQLGGTPRLASGYEHGNGEDSR